MNKLIYDCIIIGSGPAALTSAIYMKRAGYLVHIITGEKVGGALTSINSIENYPGFSEINGSDLATNIINQCEKLNIEFSYFTNVNHFYRIMEPIVNLNQSDMYYKLYALFLSDENNYLKADFYTKSIIIATGTIPKVLGLINEEKYFGHGIHTCATCDGSFYKNKNVFVIGGGNTALSSALYLSKLCKKVTIIHRRDTFRAEQALIDACKNKVNIHYLLNATLSDLVEKDNKLIGAKILYNNKKLERKIDGIFYALGTNIVEIPYIENSNNDSKIFKTGDCILSPEYHQVIIAAGDGAKTAINCIKSLK